MKKPLFVNGQAWFGNDTLDDKKPILIVSGKNDRFGSQYSAQMSAFALASITIVYIDLLDLKGTIFRDGIRFLWFKV